MPFLLQCSSYIRFCFCCGPPPRRPHQACQRSAEGFGSFKDSHTIEVRLAGGGRRTVTARNVLIATGGTAFKAPIDGAVRHLCCSKDDLQVKAISNEPS